MFPGRTGFLLLSCRLSEKDGASHLKRGHFPQQWNILITVTGTCGCSPRNSAPFRRKEGQGDYIKEIRLGNKKINKYLISHDDLIKAGEITFIVTENPNKK